MDNMEFTKITGAVCGALLIFLMINWASEVLYHVESGDHGHGDTHSKSAALAPASIYNIEVRRNCCHRIKFRRFTCSC